VGSLRRTIVPMDTTANAFSELSDNSRTARDIWNTHLVVTTSLGIAEELRKQVVDRPEIHSEAHLLEIEELIADCKKNDEELLARWETFTKAERESALASIR